MHEILNNQLDKWRSAADKSIRVAAFGASSTALRPENAGRYNWVDWLFLSLRTELGPHINVINAGRGGNTSQDLLQRIYRDVLSFNPDAVIITVGANDVARGVSEKQYRQNLIKIISIIQEHNALPVLQTYYRPVYEQGIQGFETAFEDFMRIKVKLAKMFEVPLIDQYKQFDLYHKNDREGYRRLFNDWIHLNHTGNFLMACNLIRQFGMKEPECPEETALAVSRLNCIAASETIT